MPFFKRRRWWRTPPSSLCLRFRLIFFRLFLLLLCHHYIFSRFDVDLMEIHTGSSLSSFFWGRSLRRPYRRGRRRRRGRSGNKRFFLVRCVYNNRTRVVSSQNFFSSSVESSLKITKFPSLSLLFLILIRPSSYTTSTDKGTILYGHGLKQD